MEACVQGIGVYGPGLDGWTNSRAVLTGAAPYRNATPVLQPTLLPATERRRAGRTVQLAVQVAEEATQQAGVRPDSAPAVFGSSGGDLQTLHELCVALTQPEKVISPTRFHNSVHNAAAGYWSIAAGALTPSVSLSCFDSTFAASLIEALCQVQTGDNAVLLVAYDYPAPEPLHAKRPIPAPFGVALLLSRRSSGSAHGKLCVTLENDRSETALANADLELLRCCVPAARSLPLLSALAGNQPDIVVIDYLGTMSLRVEVQPWR